MNITINVVNNYSPETILDTAKQIAVQDIIEVVTIVLDEKNVLTVYDGHEGFELFSDDCMTVINDEQFLTILNNYLGGK